MNADPRLRLWSLVVDLAHGRPASMEHVGAAAIAATGVDGVAVAVVLAASPRETLYVSDPVAEKLEDLTITVGEGPSADALIGGPSLVADLTAAPCVARWPGFAPAAVQVGVRALFALPLRIGAARLGVMDLYRAEPGPLTPAALADALMLTDLACALLLDADRHEQDDSGRGPPEHTALHHPQVHQATGMVMVQLGVTAAVALVRLRAHAYATDRRLGDVAGDVVARRLRFKPDPGFDSAAR